MRAEGVNATVDLTKCQQEQADQMLGVQEGGCLQWGTFLQPIAVATCQSRRDQTDESSDGHGLVVIAGPLDTE